eukprot:10111314-Lingulodinium_polyedra.AAC.1
MAPGFRWPRTLDAPARQAPRSPAGQCCTKRAFAVDVVHIILTYGAGGGGIFVLATDPPRGTTALRIGGTQQTRGRRHLCRSEFSF